MTAVQSGIAAGSIAEPGMEYFLPGWLPGLLIASVVLTALLLAVNIIQLLTILQLKRPHTIRLKGMRTKLRDLTVQVRKPKQETAPRSSKDGHSNSNIPEVSIPARPASKQPDNVIPASDKTFLSAGLGRTNHTDPGVDPPLPALQSGNGAVSIPSSGRSSPVIRPSEPLYPVEICSSVYYNPQMPVHFQKASGENTVFALWSDHTVRPSEECFMGFNSAAFYSTHRFPKAFEFVDGSGTAVDLSKAQSMKLSEVLQNTVVSIHAGTIHMERKGIIRVEVMN